MSKSNKILILRLSALGDVAMTVPVVASLSDAYPNKELIVVSRGFAQKLFAPIKGVTFVPFDPNNKHKGVKGLWKLFKTLKSIGPYDFIADLHDVIRTKFITTLFKLSGTKVVRIDKGRKEKKELTRKKNKTLKQLKSTFERYHEVFLKAGYTFNIDTFNGKELYVTSENKNLHKTLYSDKIRIGIAPFAGHIWKTWPEDKMLKLIEKLDKSGYEIFLFGGRGKEQKTLDEWSSNFNNVHNLAGQLPINHELEAISKLNVMISMDSGNMHLARLVNTPVVSIWGATHPNAGFYGWNMPKEWAVQVDLDCRPCSVYGNKPCHREDFACMNNITPEMVLEKVELITKA